MSNADTLLVPLCDVTGSRGGSWLVPRVQRVVVVILGLVLLVAAAMKAYWPISEAPTKANWLSHPVLVLAAVEMEIGLGIWLLSGVHRCLAWHTAMVCFTAFTVVSIYKGLSGEASCGCFGRLHTNPWYTAGFDAGAVVTLLVFRPRTTQPNRVIPSRAKGLFAATITLMCAALAGWITLSRTPRSLSLDDGGLTGVGSLVLLEPEKWVGKQFPLVNHVDIGRQLQQGRWLVVLYHGDCPTCQKVVPQIDQLTRADSARVALVEMPPYQPEPLKLSSSLVASLAGKLSDQKEWFATTPVIILLDNGIVRAASEGENVLKISVDAQEEPQLDFRDAEKTALRQIECGAL